MPLEDGAADLREAVLTYGYHLGWPTAEIVTFTETLTGIPWEACQAAQFLAVLDEYLAILAAIQARQHRQRRGEGGYHAVAA